MAGLFVCGSENKGVYISSITSSLLFLFTESLSNMFLLNLLFAQSTSDYQEQLVLITCVSL